MITCALHDSSVNKKKFSWEYIKSHAESRRQYVQLWFHKKTKQKFDEKKLEELEENLEYETIVYFRKLAVELIERQKELGKEKAKSFSVFGKKFTSTPVMRQKFFTSFKI